MDNKKLLKFLYKDIAELEELFAEKGAEGFDKFEIDFIQGRFKGAKQLIQILNEKEEGGDLQSQPQSQSQLVSEGGNVQVEETEKKEEIVAVVVAPTEEEKESLEALAEFEESLKEKEKAEEEGKVEAEVKFEEEEKVELKEQSQFDIESQSQIVDEVDEDDEALEEQEQNAVSDEQKVELDTKEKVNNANRRLGDSFAKEKSINELLGSDERGKLEYKLSNSPVRNLKTAIGINDRYQYIRELFEGSAEKFAEAVGALDEMDSIQEAVTYLQQNHKWKKNEISLKFVNLVKRRFPNG
jgi:hypothetical protein